MFDIATVQPNAGLTTLHRTVQVPGNGDAKFVIDLTTVGFAKFLKVAGLPGFELPVATTPDEPTLPVTMAVEKAPLGLADLSFELRQKVYKNLFKFDRPFEIGKQDCSASAQFLRTCKLVHEEGTAILYGKNSFHFVRDTRPRGTYYEYDWKEVAYKDVRRFFELIGTTNVGLDSVVIDFFAC